MQPDLQQSGKVFTLSPTAEKNLRVASLACVCVPCVSLCVCVCARLLVYVRACACLRVHLTAYIVNYNEKHCDFYPIPIPTLTQQPTSHKMSTTSTSSSSGSRVAVALEQNNKCANSVAAALCPLSNCQFTGVEISAIADEQKLQFSNIYKGSCTLSCSYDSQGVLLRIMLGEPQTLDPPPPYLPLFASRTDTHFPRAYCQFSDNDLGHVLKEYMISSETDAAQLGKRCYAISLESDNLVLRFSSDQDQLLFRKVVENVKHLRPKSVFSQRTEESSASQYFQFYGYLSQQQNMMQDYVRTSTYQRAILGNSMDFQVIALQYMRISALQRLL